MGRSQQQAPVALICGEDEFAVKERAKALYETWCAALGGSDHEIVDGGAANAGEALRAIGRLREALQTLPFFGTGKVVWLKNCNFLGEERTAGVQSVTEALTTLGEELKRFPWEGVRLLVSAGKVDKRKAFYKTLEKLGSVETFAGLSVDARDWADQAESLVRKAFQSRGREVTAEAVAELVNRVGPNSRQLESEVEKVCLYAAEGQPVAAQEVEAVATRNKHARAFALGDALGDRDLPRLLKRLDEELWEVGLSSQKSEIGLLYGLISKVRTLLMLKEMLREGWIRATSDYGSFKAQLEAAPRGELPEDRRFNPLAQNPFLLYKALPQVKRYTQVELVRAMELLLECNRQLVSSSADEVIALQRALVRIVEQPDPAAAMERTNRRTS